MATEDLIKAYGEYLDSLNIHVLRNVARRVGVYKPTDGKKENLIERTISVLIGVVPPVPPSNRGAPIKDDTLDPKYMRRLEQIREEYTLRGNAPFFENTAGVRSGDVPKHDYDKPLRMGVLELLPNGSGMLRAENCRSAADRDVFVSESAVHDFALREGDYVVCTVSMRTENNAPVLEKVLSVNERTDYRGRGRFDEFAAAYPEEKIELSAGNACLLLRCVDLFAPIGKGQRVSVHAPSSAEADLFLREVASAVRAHADRGENLHLLTLLVDCRPEDAAEFECCLSDGALYAAQDFAYTTFDMDAQEHVRAAKLIFARAARLAEMGENAVVLVNSLTRLTLAADALCDAGKKLSCGLSVAAFHIPKTFFSIARKLRDGGSITVIAAVDGGTGAESVIREGFDRLANCRIELCGQGTGARLDPEKSGTLRAESLLSAEETACVRRLRPAVTDGGRDVCRAMAQTPDNAAFVAAVNGGKTE